jgi:hypothetical protein
MEDDYSAREDVRVTIQCVSQQNLLSDFGGLKAPDSMGKISAAEVLRLRATSAVLGNRSARRFAQDDDSVVGIKNIGSPAKNTKRSKKSQALRMTILWEN